MNVYDEHGSPLEKYDLDKGYLKEGTKTIHHEAVEHVEEKGHWETVAEYPNGGKDVKWVVDVVGVEAKNAWDEVIQIQIYVPYTEEELAEKKEKDKKRAKEQQIMAVMPEIETALIAAQINTLTVGDDTALRWKILYPEWETNIKYEVGFKVQYEDRLYKCQQENTSQVGWEPPNVPALWTEINEAHSGDINDPIPYNNNMMLENGKYYTQDGVKYKCTRDSGIPVYNPLKDLVGIYVEIVE